MGAVYLVHHRGWDMDLAVKRPHADILQAAGGTERFIREAETWVNLPMHPNVVTAHYVRTVFGVPMVFADHLAFLFLGQGHLSIRVVSQQTAHYTIRILRR